MASPDDDGASLIMSDDEGDPFDLDADLEAETESEPEEDTNALLRFEEQLLRARPAVYLKEFDDLVTKEKIVLGEIPLEVVEKERDEKKLEFEERVRKQQEAHLKNLALINAQAEKSLQRFEDAAQRAYLHEKGKYEAIKKRPRVAKSRITDWFNESQDKIRMYIANRARSVKHMFGELRVVGSQGAFDLRRVNWRMVPQRVEIRINGIRGVKDKIGADTYTLTVSKWTCLGGKIMRWERCNLYSEDPPVCPLHPFSKKWIPLEKREACEVCQGWVGCTQPAYHNGTCQDHDLMFNSALVTQFRPVATIKPYTVMIFELVRVDEHEAKFLKLDCARHKKLRRFDPYNLTANIGGRGKSGAIKTKEARVVAWGAFPVMNSHFEIVRGKFKCPLLRGCVSPDIQHFRTLEQELSQDLENWLGNLYFEVIPYARVKDGKGEFDLEQAHSRNLLSLPLDFGVSKTNGTAVAGGEGASPSVAREGPRPGSVADISKIRLLSSRSANLRSSRSLAEEFRERKNELSKELWGDDRSSITGTTYSGKSENTVVTHSSIDFSFEETMKVDRGQRWKFYRFSIEPDGTFAEHDYRWWIQLQYVVRAIWDDIGPRTLMKFIFLCVIGFLTTWGQLFLRGLGVLGGLWMRSIPRSTVTVSLHGLISSYKAHYMWWYDEAFVIITGTCVNYAIIFVLMLVGYLFKRGGRRFPEQLSKFVFMFSLGMILLPIINIPVDIVNREEDSDLMRLVRFYNTKRYSPFFGYLTFLAIYFISCAILLVTLYLYTMRVHLNGILLDAYTRILVTTEAEAERSFLPYDYELSQQELQYIVSRAERWRGAHGERRKVVVEEVITTDETDESYYDIQVRVAIYTLDVEDSNYFKYHPRRINRDFYILSNGAVIEAINHKQPPGSSYVMTL